MFIDEKTAIRTNTRGLSIMSLVNSPEIVSNPVSYISRRPGWRVMIYDSRGRYRGSIGQIISAGHQNIELFWGPARLHLYWKERICRFEMI